MIEALKQGDCRTPCGCVGWNFNASNSPLAANTSHPVRVRGLEL